MGLSALSANRKRKPPFKNSNKLSEEEIIRDFKICHLEIMTKHQMMYYDIYALIIK